MAADQKFSGPEQDAPLVARLMSENEVVVSGYVRAQAWHEDGGERELYFGVYRNDFCVTQGIQKCSFVNGKVEHQIPFGFIDLPDSNTMVDYYLVWRLEDPAGGPAYTGMPHFECRLRARNL